MNWSYKTKLWLPILSFLVICLTFSNALAGKKYAAPNGSDSANGLSESTPLSLSKAFSSSSPLVPGDTLYLLDGVYEGNFVLDKSGTAAKPIYILPKSEGKAIIDAGKNRTSGTGIIVNASNVWIIGIHVTSSSLNKREDLGQSVPYESGIVVFGPNVKLINCWIYDIPGGGLELWRPALNLEVYGCVIFNNGSQSSTRGTGHGMYIQHDEPDFPKIIRNNFVFQNASQGINIFTTNPPNGGVLVFENTSFNTGAIADFNGLLFRPPHNFTVGSENNLSFSIRAYDNVFYSDLQNGRLTKDQVSNVTLGRNYQPNQDFQFYNNTLYGGGNQVEIQPLETFRFTENTFYNVHGKFFQFLTLPQSLPNTTWNSNLYYLLNSDNLGFTGLNFTDWKTNSGFDAGSTLATLAPSSSKIWVRKNNYDSKKFYVTILNSGGLDNVAVDFSSYSISPGSTYELIDIQNPFEEESKVKGTYQSGSIGFPMNRTKSLAPKGNMPYAPVHTESTLGTFQIKFSSPINPPALKDTVKIYLDGSGKGIITAEAVSKDPPTNDFTYSYSIGPEVNCQQLGIRDLVVTTTRVQSATVFKDTISLQVLDTIAPTFDAVNAVFIFDPTIGKINYGIQDFDLVDLSDNCSTFFNISLDGPEINCALVAENQGSYPRWPVTITVADQSGNKRVKQVFVEIGNIIESKKVSISSQKPLDPSGSVLRLGDELTYEVLGWYRNGQLIPNQKGKELPISSPGAYYAKLRLDTGCEVDSRVLNFEFNAPSHKELVELNLNASGKANLGLEDIFLVPVDAADWSLSKTEFSCSELGDQSVKVTYKSPLNQYNPSNSQTAEFWVKIKVQDKLAPSAEIKEAGYEFDLSKGELVFNPQDFLASVPQDNCGSGVVSVSLSKTSVTCADIDSERFTYYVDLNLILKDASGNTTTYPTAAVLKIVESKKVSLTAKGPLFERNSVELRLGEELDFDVLEWRKDMALLPGEKGTSILVTEPGRYAAVLQLKNGCMVTSKALELVYSEFPFPPVKQEVIKELNADGKAVLEVADLFENWPLPNTSLTFELSKSQFTCSDLGINEVTLLIKNTTGQSWERKVSVLVKDTIKPTVAPKNLELNLDVTKGNLTITPEMVTEVLRDNCSLKSVTLSKTQLTCEDIGKEISIGIRAEDQSGNVTESVSKILVKRLEPSLVQITGTKEFCAGNKSILELSSSSSFEVVRWRRNGVEIQGQTGKTLEVSESGVYHAVIRYQGGCLSESNSIEVKVNPIPTGEIKTEGNVLIAPEGNFTYQWFRNGEKIENATNRTLALTMMGEYTVELTSPAGCKAKLPSVTMTIAGLGGNWVKNPENLKIYPNPASAFAYVELPVDKLGAGQFEIKVYDLDGKSLENSIQILQTDSKTAQLSISSLPKGTYIIWVVGSNQSSFVGKLVVL
ncbi:putative secreted protein (Por secretion system target) [Algoriphagus boseongensis]|uniref:Putative secreted protein (Por secretion system target) n=1 Tax=Algoriphagus boseongensis TaxID=1442587 RepID=A0A4R6T8Z0_9BACT|nr:T9SS type A sorting domain-containing protein [Algoriphagus boseongensis]TDQ18699.1 putative secreted protein (Por secretion system target) [Algoriphagus boseongensis]